jgi:hypothetical protein
MKTLKRKIVNFCNFELRSQARDIVITKAINRVAMETNNALINIEEDQSIDLATVKQLARIVEFLLNIED